MPEATATVAATSTDSRIGPPYYWTVTGVLDLTAENTDPADHSGTIVAAVFYGWHNPTPVPTTNSYEPWVQHVTAPNAMAAVQAAVERVTRDAADALAVQQMDLDLP